MSEKPPSRNPEEALRRLQESRENVKKVLYKFVSPRGFSGTVEFLPDGSRHLIMSRSGNSGEFMISTEGTVHCIDVHGAEDANTLIARYTEEVETLLADRELVRPASDDASEQLEMNI